MRWVGREQVYLGIATPHLPTAGLLELAAIADRFGTGRAVPAAKAERPLSDPRVALRARSKRLICTTGECHLLGTARADGLCWHPRDGPSVSPGEAFGSSP
jgi:hypothetical protein